MVVFLRYEDEILLLKRSEKVDTHKNRWGVVTGYLDELKPVIEKAFEEMREETGVTKDQIFSIERGKIYKFDGGDTIYISHPFLMKLKDKVDVDLSWEHNDYKWVNIKNVENYLPKFAFNELKTVLSDK